MFDYQMRDNRALFAGENAGWSRTTTSTRIQTSES